MGSTASLGVERLFTKPKSKAYDQLKWAKRDSVIMNPMTGKPVFEQLGVEFPQGWSLNAINIVAQKYFTGSPGSDDRESSLKHLINRVVDTVVRQGQQEGYFETATEAEDFREELKFILATQRAAFNSPVWFNIGAMERAQQASACFILGIDDTMESILNWYKE
jgi:ribonucleoside-diphosphate reductase alpha chain